MNVRQNVSICTINETCSAISVSQYTFMLLIVFIFITSYQLSEVDELMDSVESQLPEDFEELFSLVSEGKFKE